MKTEAEKKADQQFFITNGETPDEEAARSGRGIGLVAIFIMVVIAAKVLDWLL